MTRYEITDGGETREVEIVAIEKSELECRLERVEMRAADLAGTVRALDQTLLHTQMQLEQAAAMAGLQLAYRRRRRTRPWDF